jgi:DNA-binding transcriptional LysR family regulator
MIKYDHYSLSASEAADAMVEFRTLETFVWVAKLGSFRGAATKLHTTQPAISARIAQLEGELGVRLLDRDRRKVALTERGRELIDHAERLLRLRSELMEAVADRSSVRGTLRLGVAETIVHTWLSRFIERMSVAYPALALEIEVDVSVNLRDRLLAQEIDLAFMLGPVSSPMIRSRHLCTFPIAFVASPRLRLPATRLSITTIAEWPVITFARNTQPYVNVRELLSDPRRPAPRIHASASVATIVRMALDGIGIAAIPPAIVARELKMRQLRLVPTKERVPDMTFVAGWLVTPDTRMTDHVVAIAGEVAHEDTAGHARPARAGIRPNRLKNERRLS